MEEVMGTLPGEERRVPLQVRLEKETVLEGYTLRTITFAAEPADRVRAHILLPAGLSGKSPAVLCLHQSTYIGKDEPAGIAGLANLHYAHELALRRYVTCCPDYPGYGTYTINPYLLGYQSTTMKAIWNHMAAVDLLQSMEEVDPHRIGCIGHSLGGHNCLFLAAFDERIRAAVTSCGFCSFATYLNGNITNWSIPKYMPKIASVYGNDPARIPFDFSDILSAIAPRAVFINAPLRDSDFSVEGVRDCVRAARAVYATLNAGDNLVVVHPDQGHAFPRKIRKMAYRFLDSHLSSEGSENTAEENR